MLCLRRSVGTLLLAALALGAAASGSPQDEHAKHHPSPSSATGATPAQNTAPQAGMQSEMGRGMGEMMERMGAPPPKELYPALMELPDLPPERRAEVQRLAHERMTEGVKLISSSLEQLTESTSRENYAAMQDATEQLRIGLAQFESGLAAHRALAEGRAPRNVALEWFKKDMNLLPPVAGTPHGFFGLSWFHYIVMFILTAFAITMIGMYFNKMRRAQALVARLAGASGSAAVVDAGDSAARPRSPSEVAASATPVPDIPPEAPSKPNSWTGLLRVARIFQETPTVKSFRLVDPAGALLPFTYMPGQFLTVGVASDGGSIKRSYTIASSSTQRAYAEITVKREEHGVVSQFLHDRVHEGDTLQVTAPSGKFTFTGEDAPSIVLIAGGVGVMPMMSVARYLTERGWGGEIFFLYAAKSDAEVIFREELEYLRKRHPNLHLMLVVDQIESPDWPYAKGRITRELLDKTVPDLRRSRVHICGPPAMMSAIKEILTELGIPSDQIRTEVFQGKEQPRPKLETLPPAQAKVAVVTFAKSNRTAMLPPNKTVLEASEEVAVNIQYSCRIGTCGVCRTKLLAGAVTMEVQDGLEPGDKENNIILACQAKSTADLSVDA